MNHYRKVLASIPLTIYFHDSVASIYTVQGDSMKPNLLDGDVILVKKMDFVSSYFQILSRAFYSDSTHNRSEEKDGNSTRQIDSDAIERMKSVEVDETVGFLKPWFYYSPVVPVPGDAVVFYSPSEFRNCCHVKRVIAVGGQMVRPTGRERQIEEVPPYHLWLEGDNSGESIDSRSYGCVNKKLLIGTASFIVWPPSRWGAINCKKPDEGKAWWWFSWSWS